MTPCTVFACESHPIVLEGLRSLLGGSSEFCLVGEAATPAAALREMGSLRPGLALIDHERGWREVLQIVNELKRLSPETRIVLWGAGLTASDCARALRAGIGGVFHRILPLASLVDCLRGVSAGQVWVEGLGDSVWTQQGGGRRQPRLTPREKDIVRLVSGGLKNREIAEKLAISVGTVKVHLMHVFEKTGVKDRYQLSARSAALLDRKSTRLNSSHTDISRMPSSA